MFRNKFVQFGVLAFVALLVLAPAVKTETKIDWEFVRSAYESPGVKNEAPPTTPSPERDFALAVNDGLAKNGEQTCYVCRKPLPVGTRSVLVPTQPAGPIVVRLYHCSTCKWGKNEQTVALRRFKAVIREGDNSERNRQLADGLRLASN